MEWLVAGENRNGMVKLPLDPLGLPERMCLVGRTD